MDVQSIFNNSLQKQKWMSKPDLSRIKLASLKSPSPMQRILHNCTNVNKVVENLKSRPQSALCPRNKPASLLKPKRPVSATIPRLRLHVHGRGYCGDNETETEKNVADENLADEILSRDTDELQVPPCSPKIEECISLVQEYGYLLPDLDVPVYNSATSELPSEETSESLGLSHIIPKQEVHLQLPVMMQDECSDSCDSDRLVKGSVEVGNEENSEKLVSSPQSSLNFSQEFEINNENESTNNLNIENDCSLVDISEVDNSLDKLSEVLEYCVLCNEKQDDNLYGSNLNVTQATTANICEKCKAAGRNKFVRVVSESVNSKTIDVCKADGDKSEQLLTDNGNENYCESRKLIGPKGQVVDTRLNLYKNSVHFKEEKNRVVRITPRNKGRKIRSHSAVSNNHIDSRFLTDADYCLALDICAMPLQGMKNSKSFMEKSRLDMHKIRNKMDAMLSSVKRGSTATVDEPHVGAWVKGKGKLVSAMKSVQKSDHESVGKHGMGDGDSSEANAQLDSNNAESGSHCGKIRSGSVVYYCHKCGKNKLLEKRALDMCAANDRQLVQFPDDSGFIIYDAKPLTQQDTKYISTSEQNYYQEVCKNTESKLHKSTLLAKKNKAKKDYDCKSLPNNQEEQILNCIQTKAIENEPHVQEEAPGAMRPPKVAWTAPDESKKHVREKQTIGKISPKPSSPKVQKRPPRPSSAAKVNGHVKQTQCSGKSMNTPQANGDTSHEQSLASNQSDNQNTKPSSPPGTKQRVSSAKTHKKSSSKKCGDQFSKTCTNPLHTVQKGPPVDKKNGAKNVHKSVSTSYLEMAKIYAPNSKIIPQKRRSHTSHSANRRKTPTTEGVCLFSKTDTQEIDSQAMEECRHIHKHLEQNGVDLDIKTLKRALLPPDGSTTHFKLGNNLPKDNSEQLFTNPKTWLPEEHNRLRHYADLLKKSEIQVKHKLDQYRTSKKKRKRPSSAST